MFGMDLLLNLAFAFFFGGPWGHPWQDLDRPLADLGIYCSAPCDCPRDSPCKKD